MPSSHAPLHPPTPFLPAPGQISSLKSSTADLEALRREYAALEAAAAEGEGLAALNSELRLILLGAEGAVEEHERLVPLAREAAGMKAEVGELREQLEEAPRIRVGVGGRSGPWEPVGAVELCEGQGSACALLTAAIGACVTESSAHSCTLAYQTA